MDCGSHAEPSEDVDLDQILHKLFIFWFVLWDFWILQPRTHTKRDFTVLWDFK